MKAIQLKLKKRGLLNIVIMMGFLFIMLPYSNATNYTISSSSELSALSLSAGDTVIMSASASWSNVNLVFKGAGTAENNIVLTVENTDITISGASNLKIAGSYLRVDGLQFKNGYSPSGAIVEFRESSSSLSNNCRLSNCTIEDFNPSINSTDYKWVSIYGQYNRVDHCSISGKTHAGTTVVVWIKSGVVNHTQIDHNYFGHRPDLGENGGETIRIGDSSTSMENSSAIVEYNLFEECDGEIEIISNKSCFNVYRHNTFRKSAGMLTLRHGNDCEVYGNFFFGENKDNSGGIRIIGERHKVYNNYLQGLKGSNFRSAITFMNGRVDSEPNGYFQVINALVAFNTIIDCEMPISLGEGLNKDETLSLAPLNCTIANNVVYATSGSAIDMEDTPINMTWEGNYFNTSSEPISNTGISLVNDLLISSDGTLWRPSASSILIGAAEGIYDDINLDIDGHERTSPKDVGCDQYSTADTLFKPLNAIDVGPYTEEGSEIPSDGGNSGETIDNKKLPIINALASTEQSPNVAGNVWDGITDNRWSGEGDGAYITVELDQTYLVQYLKVGLFKGDERSTYFDIQTSVDGIKYTDAMMNITSQISTATFLTYDIIDIDAKFVRITGHGNSSGSLWNSFTEIEVYGDSATATHPSEEKTNISHAYPVPAIGSFTISNTLDKKIDILNTSGQVVYSNPQSPTNELIIDCLPRGIYMISTKLNKQTHKFKMVIK